jgi:hypothetical protein
MQQTRMAIKPNAVTCWLREQTIEDLPSGITLRLEKQKDGVRLTLVGRVLPKGNREIVFDSEGCVVSVGPLLKNLHL